MALAVRMFAALSLFILMAACAPTVLVDESRSQSLVVGSIDIDTSQFAGLKGREFQLPPEQVAADIERELRAVLTRPGAANADIKLVVSNFRLVSPGQAFALGGQSAITGTLTVVDQATGAEIVPPTEVVGISEQLRLGGVIGAVTSPAADKDYRQTLRGFAASIHQQLYGVKPGEVGA